MKLIETFSPGFFPRISRYLLPQLQSTAIRIDETLESLIRSGRAWGPDDDIAISAAVSTEIATLGFRAMDNEPYLLPGARVIPKFPRILIERQISPWIVERSFTPGVSIPVLSICRDAECGQYFFQSVVQGVGRLLPMDREYFPVCQG